MWRLTGNGATVVIETYGPILITTWYGTVDREVIDRLYDRLELIYRQHQTIRVSIANVVELRRLPRARDRRRMAARTEGLTQWMASDQLNIVVMHNGLVRTGLAAVQWLTRTPNRAEPSGSIEDAFARARRALRTMGARWPQSLEPETYEVPDRAESAATG